MNVVDLLKNADTLINKEVTVVGRLDRPRKKHSNYLFFNIDNGFGVGIQAILKKDILGKSLFKELSYGLSHGKTVTVTGTFNLRNSNRNEFYKYEILVKNIIID